MRLVSVATAAAVLAATSVAAVPPPPLPLPEHIPPEFEGYDTRHLFALYGFWVQGQRGKAVETIFARERPSGAALIEFEKYNDHGLFLKGVVVSHCADYRERKDCELILFRTYFDEGRGARDAEAAWAGSTFNHEKLVERLSNEGYAPDTDWMRVDRDELFADHPSPVSHLVSLGGTTVTLRGKECPAMVAAIADIEGKSLTIPIDLTGIARDAKIDAPRPHAVQAFITLNSRHKKAPVSIRSNNEFFYDLITGPVLDAADECEDAGAGTRSVAQ